MIVPSSSWMLHRTIRLFDFCNMPFKDNRIDIISDGGGIIINKGKVIEDRGLQEIVAEIYRR